MHSFIGFKQLQKRPVGEFLLLLYNATNNKRQISTMDKRGKPG